MEIKIVTYNNLVKFSTKNTPIKEISPLGLINNNLIENYEEYIIYKGMKYNITKRNCDIKKDYKDKKRFTVYTCQYHRKYENLKNQYGYFCNAQIVLDRSYIDNNELITIYLYIKVITNIYIN